jgi:DNA-binding NarL/FixJ family response regulator
VQKVGVSLINRNKHRNEIKAKKDMNPEFNPNPKTKAILKDIETFTLKGKSNKQIASELTLTQLC